MSGNPLVWLSAIRQTIMPECFGRERVLLLIGVSQAESGQAGIEKACAGSRQRFNSGAPAQPGWRRRRGSALSPCRQPVWIFPVR
jgi:hypothetical protein